MSRKVRAWLSERLLNSANHGVEALIAIAAASVGGIIILGWDAATRLFIQTVTVPFWVLAALGVAAILGVIAALKDRSTFTRLSPLEKVLLVSIEMAANVEGARITRSGLIAAIIDANPDIPPTEIKHALYRLRDRKFIQFVSGVTGPGTYLPTRKGIDYLVKKNVRADVDGETTSTS